VGAAGGRGSGESAAVSAFSGGSGRDAVGAPGKAPGRGQRASARLNSALGAMDGAMGVGWRRKVRLWSGSGVGVVGGVCGVGVGNVVVIVGVKRKQTSAKCA
jgi:hypothetical protein